GSENPETAVQVERAVRQSWPANSISREAPVEAAISEDASAERSASIGLPGDRVCPCPLFLPRYVRGPHLQSAPVESARRFPESIGQNPDRKRTPLPQLAASPCHLYYRPLNPSASSPLRFRSKTDRTNRSASSGSPPDASAPRSS